MTHFQIVRYNLVFNRKKEAITKGKALVQIEAYLNGNRRYFSTGIYLVPGDWNVKLRQPKDHYLKGQIRFQISKLEEFERNQKIVNNNSFELLDFDKLKQTKTAAPTAAPSTTTFNEFLKQQIEARNKELKWNTYRQQKACLNLLNEFDPSLTFIDLKFEKIDLLNQFMINKGHCNTTTQKRHKIIKGYLNKAVKMDLLSSNPYDNFKIASPIINKTALTIHEVIQLENLDLPENKKRLKKVCDMFLFSVYTGLRWGDIVALTNHNFIHTESSIILNTKAEKTGKGFALDLSLMFNGKAQTLINGYLTTDPNEKVFKGIYNAFANKALKELATIAGIKKKLHFHIARHTAATLIAQKAGVLAAQQVLQHGKLATTQQYLHLANTERDQALANVNNWY